MTTLFAPTAIYRTEVPGRIPAAENLEVGQLSVNLADKKLFSKNLAGDVVVIGDGNSRTAAISGVPSLDGEVPGEIYLQLPAPGGDLQTWVWDEPTTSWSAYAVRGSVRNAVDVEDTDPFDGDLLSYDLALGQWTPISSFEATQSRTFVNVSGTVVIDDTLHFRALVYTGVNPVAEFAAGVESVVVEVYNRTTNALTLQAATGVTLTNPSGFGFVRPGGAAEAVFVNGVWSVTGDLFLPGSSSAFDLEDADDYEAAASKADGDLVAWDASLQKFSTAPIDTTAIKTYLQTNLQLGDLSDVNIVSQIDQTYLFFDATASEFRLQALPLDSIAEDVQLRTELGELSNVAISSVSDQDQLVYDLASTSWVNVPGGQITLKADKLAEIKSIPTNYTVIADDSTKILRVLGLATISLPSTLEAGFQVVVIQTGTDDVDFSATTLLSSGDRSFLRTQYSVATAVHLGSGTWYVFGDLRLEGTIEVPEVLSDLANVSIAVPTPNQVLGWTGSVWSPVTIETGADLSTSSINELADVDTASTSPTIGQGFIWNGSKWAPGAVSADISAESIDALADVDTSTVTPSLGNVLAWDGANWAPGVPPSSVNVLADLSDVEAFSAAPTEGGNANTRILEYSATLNTWRPNAGQTVDIQARDRFSIHGGYTGTGGSGTTTTNFLSHVLHSNDGVREVEIELSSLTGMAANSSIMLRWPSSQPPANGLFFADWDANDAKHDIAIRQLTLTDITELNAGPYNSGDAVFYDGFDWTTGDIFASSFSVITTDIGTGTANMIGPQGFYANQAALEGDGFTYITGGGIDDESTAFDPGPAWTGLDFLSLGVSSQNWKVADVAVHFDADPSHEINNYDQPMTAWGFDLLVQLFTSDSTLQLAGWKVHNDGTQDWLVVRSEHVLPYGDDTGLDGIACESWFSQDGRIRMMYGTPQDTNGDFTFQVSPTSNGICSNGSVVANPDGLTISGNRAYEFSVQSTAGVVLGRLGDVDTAGALTGDVLRYDGAGWGTAAAIDKAQLQAEVAASVDFADFQARIAAL